MKLKHWHNFSWEHSFMIYIDLLKLVESIILFEEGDKYIQLINTCPSKEWKDLKHSLSKLSEITRNKKVSS